MTADICHDENKQNIQKWNKNIDKRQKQNKNQNKQMQTKITKAKTKEKGSVNIRSKGGRNNFSSS